VKQKSKRWFIHLIYPALGLVVLAFVLYNARAAAQVLGLGWLAIGIIVAVVLKARGREIKTISVE
jgi:hypothetical protein